MRRGKVPCINSIMKSIKSVEDISDRSNSAIKTGGDTTTWHSCQAKQKRIRINRSVGRQKHAFVMFHLRWVRLKNSSSQLPHRIPSWYGGRSSNFSGYGGCASRSRRDCSVRCREFGSWFNSVCEKCWQSGTIGWK